jgi:hypothetical protein
VKCVLVCSEIHSTCLTPSHRPATHRTRRNHIRHVDTLSTACPDQPYCLATHVTKAPSHHTCSPPTRTQENAKVQWRVVVGGRKERRTCSKGSREQAWLTPTPNDAAVTVIRGGHATSCVWWAESVRSHQQPTAFAAHVVCVRVDECISPIA